MALDRREVAARVERQVLDTVRTRARRGGAEPEVDPVEIPGGPVRGSVRHPEHDPLVLLLPRHPHLDDPVGSGGDAEEAREVAARRIAGEHLQPPRGDVGRRRDVAHVAERVLALDDPTERLREVLGHAARAEARGHAVALTGPELRALPGRRRAAADRRHDAGAPEDLARVAVRDVHQRGRRADDVRRLRRAVARERAGDGRQRGQALAADGAHESLARLARLAAGLRPGRRVAVGRRDRRRGHPGAEQQRDERHGERLVADRHGRPAEQRPCHRRRAGGPADLSRTSARATLRYCRNVTRPPLCIFR